MQNEPTHSLTGGFERLCFAYGVTPGRGSVERLAAVTGQNINTVKGWRQRGSVPLVHLIQAARVTGRTVEWLLKEPDQVQVPTFSLEGIFDAPDHAPAEAIVQEARSPERSFEVLDSGRVVRFVLIPRYDVSASAGSGSAADGSSEHPIGEIAFETMWMRRNLGRSGTGFAIVDVVGDSMEPTLREGQTVVIDLMARDIVKGGVFVLRDGSDLFVKRLTRLLGGAVQVLSDNPRYEPQRLEPHSEVQVVGKVVWPPVR